MSWLILIKKHNESFRNKSLYITEESRAVDIDNQPCVESHSPSSFSCSGVPGSPSAYKKEFYIYVKYDIIMEERLLTIKRLFCRLLWLQRLPLRPLLVHALQIHIATLRQLLQKARVVCVWSKRWNLLCTTPWGRKWKLRCVTPESERLRIVVWECVLLCYPESENRGVVSVLVLCEMEWCWEDECYCVLPIESGIDNSCVERMSVVVLSVVMLSVVVYLERLHVCMLPHSRRAWWSCAAPVASAAASPSASASETATACGSADIMYRRLNRKKSSIQNVHYLQDNDSKFLKLSIL